MKNKQIVEKLLELYESLIQTEEYLNMTDADVSIKEDISRVKDILGLIYSDENEPNSIIL